VRHEGITQYRQHKAAQDDEAGSPASAHPGLRFCPVQGAKDAFLPRAAPLVDRRFRLIQHRGNNFRGWSNKPVVN
jgi:hypothetical protein